MYKVSVYKCRFCGAYFEDREEGAFHETSLCELNPCVFSCVDCEHSISKKLKNGKMKVYGCRKGHKRFSVMDFIRCKEKSVKG